MYWLVVLAVYLPFYIVASGSQFNVLELFKTMVGAPGIFNYGWYVYFYIILLLLMPIIRKILDKNIFVSVGMSYIPMLAIYAVMALFAKNFPFYNQFCNVIIAFSSSLIGYTFSRFGIFGKINNSHHKNFIRLWGVIIGFLLIISYALFGRGILLSIGCPFIMIGIVPLFSINNKFLDTCFSVLGENSMNMRFIHGVILSDIVNAAIPLKTIFFSSGIGAVVLIISLMAILLVSLIFTFADKYILKIIDLLFSTRQKKTQDL